MILSLVRLNTKKLFDCKTEWWKVKMNHVSNIYHDLIKGSKERDFITVETKSL